MASKRQRACRGDGLASRRKSLLRIATGRPSQPSRGGETNFRASRFVRVAIPSAIRNPPTHRRSGWLHPTLRLKEATSGVKTSRFLEVSPFLTVPESIAAERVAAV